MDRGMSAEMNAAIVARVIRPVLLFDGTFNSGDVHLWTGVGELTHGATVYNGAGDLLSISAMEETNEVKASGITLTLSGVKSGSVAKALAEVRRYLPGTLALALIDDDGMVVDDPWPLFRGLMNSCSIEDGADTASVTIGYEHELIDLERPVNTRYTDAEQRRLFPGDTGLRYLIRLQNKVLRWGSRG